MGHALVSLQSSLSQLETIGSQYPSVLPLCTAYHTVMQQLLQSQWSQVKVAATIKVVSDGLHHATQTMGESYQLVGAVREEEAVTAGVAGTVRTGAEEAERQALAPLEAITQMLSSIRKLKRDDLFAAKQYVYDGSFVQSSAMSTSSASSASSNPVRAVPSSPQPSVLALPAASVGATTEARSSLGGGVGESVANAPLPPEVPYLLNVVEGLGEQLRRTIGATAQAAFIVARLRLASAAAANEERDAGQVANHEAHAATALRKALEAQGVPWWEFHAVNGGDSPIHPFASSAPQSTPPSATKALHHQNPTLQRFLESQRSLAQALKRKEAARRKKQTFFHEAVSVLTDLARQPRAPAIVVELASFSHSQVIDMEFAEAAAEATRFFESQAALFSQIARSIDETSIFPVASYASANGAAAASLPSNMMHSPSFTTSSTADVMGGMNPQRLAFANFLQREASRLKEDHSGRLSLFSTFCDTLGEILLSCARRTQRDAAAAHLLQACGAALETFTQGSIGARTASSIASLFAQARAGASSKGGSITVGASTALASPLSVGSPRSTSRGLWESAAADAASPPVSLPFELPALEHLDSERDSLSNVAVYRLVAPLRRADGAEGIRKLLRDVHAVLKAGKHARAVQSDEAQSSARLGQTEHLLRFTSRSSSVFTHFAFPSFVSTAGSSTASTYPLTLTLAAPPASATTALIAGRTSGDSVGLESRRDKDGNDSGRGSVTSQRAVPAFSYTGPSSTPPSMSSLLPLDAAMSIRPALAPVVTALLVCNDMAVSAKDWGELRPSLESFTEIIKASGAQIDVMLQAVTAAFSADVKSNAAEPAAASQRGGISPVSAESGSSSALRCAVDACRHLVDNLSAVAAIQTRGEGMAHGRDHGRYGSMQWQPGQLLTAAPAASASASSALAAHIPSITHDSVVRLACAMHHAVDSLRKVVDVVGAEFARTRNQVEQLARTVRARDGVIAEQETALKTAKVVASASSTSAAAISPVGSSQGRQATTVGRDVFEKGRNTGRQSPSLNVQTIASAGSEEGGGGVRVASVTPSHSLRRPSHSGKSSPAPATGLLDLAWEARARGSRGPSVVSVQSSMDQMGGGDDEADDTLGDSHADVGGGETDTYDHEDQARRMNDGAGGSNALQDTPTTPPRIDDEEHATLESILESNDIQLRRFVAAKSPLDRLRTLDV